MNQMLKYLYDGISGEPIQENPFTTTELEILIGDLREYLQTIPNSRKADDLLMIILNKSQQASFEAGFYASTRLFITK